MPLAETQHDASLLCGRSVSGFQLWLGLHLAKLAAWNRRKKLFFAINQVGCVESSQFETVAVSNGVRGAGFHAISAKNTAVVINVIDRGISLGSADAILRRVLGGFDINAIRRTRSSAKEAGNTLLQTIFVAL